MAENANKTIMFTRAVLKREKWKQNKSQCTFSHIRTNAWDSWYHSDHCHLDHAYVYDHDDAYARMFFDDIDLFALVLAEHGAARQHTCVNARSLVYQCFDGNLTLPEKHYNRPNPSSLLDFLDPHLSKRSENISPALVHCWHVLLQSSQTVFHLVEETGRSVY